MPMPMPVPAAGYGGPMPMPMGASVGLGGGVVPEILNTTPGVTGEGRRQAVAATRRRTAAGQEGRGEMCQVRGYVGVCTCVRDIVWVYVCVVETTVVTCVAILWVVRVAAGKRVELAAWYTRWCALIAQPRPGGVGGGGCPLPPTPAWPVAVPEALCSPA